MATPQVQPNRPSERSQATVGPFPDKVGGGRASTVLLLVGADLTAAGAALPFAPPHSVLAVFAVSLLAWQFLGLYRRRFTMSVLDDLPRLILGLVWGVALVALVDWLDLVDAARGVVVLFASLLVTRSVAYAAVRRCRARGHETFPTLIVGSGPAANSLVQRLKAHPETGLRLVELIDHDCYTGDASDLYRLMTDSVVTDVVLCVREDLVPSLMEELREWERPETAVHTVSALFELQPLNRASDQIWGVPLHTIRRPGNRRLARRTKRAMDVVISSVVLILTLPIAALVAVAVRLEVGPDVVFRQERVGWQGRRFDLLKFRSIRTDVGAEAVWATAPIASFIGPVGRFIRRYSLDELPQLLNVLRGDMSLVGPRPERPVFVEQFNREVPGYRFRHRAPVGLTGLSAVIGLRGGSSSLQDRAYFDNLYIENWSLWLDIKILCVTVLAILRGTGS